MAVFPLRSSRIDLPNCQLDYAACQAGRAMVSGHAQGFRVFLYACVLSVRLALTLQCYYCLVTN